MHSVVLHSHDPAQWSAMECWNVATGGWHCIVSAQRDQGQIRGGGGGGGLPPFGEDSNTNFWLTPSLKFLDLL